MNEKSGQEPLLSMKEDVDEYANKKPSLVSSIKWILRAAMWLIFITWIVVIFLFPSEFASSLYLKLIMSVGMKGASSGRTAIIFLLFSAPVLLIAFLATAYLALRGEDEIHRKKASRYPRFRLWTFPVLVDGPFGVVSAAEIIGIVLVVVFVLWALGAYTVRNYKILPLFDLPSKEWSLVMLELTGLRFGMIGIFCLGFLFMPVARGSILLRLIDIPFEHATRYHVWLGHLTILLFTLHGLFFVIPWTIEGRLEQELRDWKSVGVANFPGVVSLLAGLVMWVTSLPGVRRVNFELFFYTHQLYIVFIIGLALHVGDFIFCYCAGGVFLFILDRFLRFCQSRREVNVLSARCFPCGTLELVLSKPANLHYNALGWVFLQVRELSWLQWHPFSVSSSPLSGKNHLAILIKVLGDWTGRLEKHISIISGQGGDEEQLLQPHSRMTAFVEGPYGHESPYHLTYENLILVAGGIGISPFLAILSDVLHRIRDGKPCMPRNILIVWAIKTPDELPLLQTAGIESICPTFSSALNLEIQTYVTRASGPSLEEGKTLIEPVDTAAFPASRECGMSVCVGTGNVIWSGAYIVVSTLGCILIWALLDAFYFKPYNVYIWWYKGLLLIASMVVSVLVFGGLVICAWHLWGTRTSPGEDEDSLGNGSVRPDEPKDAGEEQYVSSIWYGQRPDLGGIFESMSERWGNVDIGVIVCGPPALQTSVAKGCRTQNLKQCSNKAIFHFNSHSFDL